MITILKMFISSVLSATLLLECLPMVSFAAPEAAKEEAAEGTSASAEITAELPSAREASVKHFFLSDGTLLAVNYGDTVHYQDKSGAYAADYYVPFASWYF